MGCGAIGCGEDIAHGIVGVGPGGFPIGQALQLTPMLPGVGVGAVAEGVAYGIISNGNAIVSREQIAPAIVAVGVMDGIRGRAQSAGGVGM